MLTAHPCLDRNRAEGRIVSSSELFELLIGKAVLLKRRILFLDGLEYFFGGTLPVSLLNGSKSIDLDVQVCLHAIDLFDDFEDALLRVYIPLLRLSFDRFTLQFDLPLQLDRVEHDQAQPRGVTLRGRRLLGLDRAAEVECGRLSHSDYLLLAKVQNERPGAGRMGQA